MAYDFYGQRLATCSSDKSIKIWGREEDKWVLKHTIKGHGGVVFKVAWAHPVFGQVIASSSSDKTVTIWEEQTNPDSGQVEWTRRATLLESVQSVSYIQFAPKNWGLKLATASSDGYVRIYAAENALDVAHWQQENDFLVSSGDGLKNDDAASKNVADGTVRHRSTGDAEPTCLSWCSSTFDEPMIAVGTSMGQCQIWCYNKTVRKWQCVKTLDQARGTVNDISWSPRLGRSYHLIASASQDKIVRIWKISADSRDFVVDQMWEKTEHRSEVWSVDWNVTGTVLASTGDDSCVRLWKITPSGDVVMQKAIGAPVSSS